MSSVRVVSCRVVSVVQRPAQSRCPVPCNKRSAARPEAGGRVHVRGLVLREVVSCCFFVCVRRANERRACLVALFFRLVSCAGDGACAFSQNVD
ncbi:hypothetical protein HETIRDRAFT_162462 [Heterobasidion irregulare TC 32-1]|uniref:Uncharacterized protein n=1 Tax=Heterobasidion irregulare (strain TC 32-1) TaxID=747525 RepID=W4JRJ2_HETIT|nr:uncharacterized protein HETIRDRAFT_162462 [Heterobasidion irregulare TC 32-1]ETW75700.1 hypothetical protein HETIRDRAFT_162462 [Heterobasidion irregulare TC 32-1]